MLTVEKIEKNQVTLVSNIGNKDVVDFKEVRRRLLNNIEIDGLALNDNGDLIDKDGNIIDKVSYKQHTKNSNLSKAKAEKNDEFYTRLEDIEAELSHYPKEYFKDKVIYCPTDVAVNTGRIMQSQFVRYFQINAHRLQFKKLIATCLVYKAAGEAEEDLESVQNCYILERRNATNLQKMLYSRNPFNTVVDEVENVGMYYKTEDGSTHPMPYHVVNQAVTAPEGKFKIVKRYIDHYDENGNIVLGTEDKGIKWDFKGHKLSIKWCRKHPNGTIEMLPEECYYDNSTPTGEDFLTDFSVFPKDEEGNHCFEDLDSFEDMGSVGLYPPEFYDYQEIDYTEYDEYFEHCPSDEEYVSGDYRSEYCQKLFKEADVVVTNPPFSLFRDFVGNLELHNLKYILWGNNNAIITKDIFILVQQNKLWLGYTFNKNLDFRVPIGYAFNKEINGIKYGTVPAISVFTNYEIDKQHDLLILSKKYNDTIYPTYINYDAIDVDKITNIPCDYEGIMGVPLTFLGQYNAEQFEIVGLGHGDLGKSIGVGENITDEEFKQYHSENSNIRRGHTFYRGKDGKLKIPYVKVLIRKKGL